MGYVEQVLKPNFSRGHDYPPAENQLSRQWTPKCRDKPQGSISPKHDTSGVFSEIGLPRDGYLRVVMGCQWVSRRQTSLVTGRLVTRCGI